MANSSQRLGEMVGLRMARPTYSRTSPFKELKLFPKIAIVQGFHPNGCGSKRQPFWERHSTVGNLFRKAEKAQLTQSFYSFRLASQSAELMFTVLAACDMIQYLFIIHAGVRLCVVVGCSQVGAD